MEGFLSDQYRFVYSQWRVQVLNSLTDPDHFVLSFDLSKKKRPVHTLCVIVSLNANFMNDQVSSLVSHMAWKMEMEKC